ncbi:phenylalanine--tRNA ligase subunit alpha [Candidatus Marinamargulisbacteria bacterium SCGC AG-414-C22]|nr:phenylalanine--tRNA ligase subunit alpha [Candidatus Marinamargulisbacteria bacterium SCGC AG-414-C22]
MAQHLKDITKQLSTVEQLAKAELADLTTLIDLDNYKAKWLGKKSDIQHILKQVSQLDVADRPIVGKEVNILKKLLNELIDEKKAVLASAELNQKLSQQRDDVTLPSYKAYSGSYHPITLTIQKLQRLFNRLGFSNKFGPDVETDFYNFEALNIDEHHPARDMHDTFYLKSGAVLRTHTSPVQIRTMLAQEPPIKIIAPGKVYRCDADTSHSPVFHQIEGLYVDKHVTFSHLKGILEFFLKELFGTDKNIRFRSSYFPFTEPSVEVDVEYDVNGTKKWMEIMGAGMINREVFRHVNYNPDDYTGFAFGIGIERVAMILHKIDDIRLFYENDKRFISQFKQRTL